MKIKIKRFCKNIEKDNNIKILFAVENGSRAWRMESKNSDYDVRFVFVRPVEDYIQINKLEQVIQVAYDKYGEKCSVEGSLIDISGFDVFKYIKLLSNSNPTTIEWLNSDIVYYGKQNNVFKKFALRSFSKKSLYFHYKSMCRNNYIKYLKDGNEVTYKKYLYAFRGLINAKWVAYKKTVPPISFIETLQKSSDLIDKGLLDKLNDIIELKSKGKEKDIVQNIVQMDKFIENFLKNDDEAPREKDYVNLNDLNNELRKIVLGKN